MDSNSIPDVRVEPELGHTWASIDPYSRGVTSQVVGVTTSHVLVRSRNQVLRIRIDTFHRNWRWVPAGTLPPDRVVIAVDRGGNPYGVKEGQCWKAHSKVHNTTVEVVEVNEDDGVAIVRSRETGRQTRIRLDRFRSGATGYSLLNRKAQP